jgi:hypothetical protein
MNNKIYKSVMNSNLHQKKKKRRREIKVMSVLKKKREKTNKNLLLYYESNFISNYHNFVDLPPGGCKTRLDE